MPESITVIGLDELRQRLRDPEMIKGAIKIFGARAARTGKRMVVNDLKGGTNRASQAVVAKADLRAGEIFVKSRLPFSRAISIEEGRMPGQVVYLSSLMTWYEAVTGQSERRPRKKSNKTYSAVQLRRIRESAMEKRSQRRARVLDQVTRIQAQIQRRGTEGKHSFQEVFEEWQKNLPRWLDEAATRIEKKFSQK